MKKAALYLRVSTGEQSIENQARELSEAAERHGWCIAKVYKDEGISGSKGRDKRPAFDALCRAMARREFDLVAAWSVDRLGRSLQDLVAFLGEIKAAGVDLYLHKQGLDTSSPAGKALFQMLGVFSEFERSIIVERTLAGLARARAQGKRLGRPKVSADIEDAVRAELAAGNGIVKVARSVGCGVGTVARIKAAALEIPNPQGRL